MTELSAVAARDFRGRLQTALKQGIQDFDLNHLVDEVGADAATVQHATRVVFLSQCLRAADDGRITPLEQTILSQLAACLQLSQQEQERCVNSARNKMFQQRLDQYYEDWEISDEEAASLKALRATLGLCEIEREEYDPGIRAPLHCGKKPIDGGFSRYLPWIKRLIILVLVLIPSFLISQLSPVLALVPLVICGLIYGLYWSRNRCAACGASWSLEFTDTHYESEWGRDIRVRTIKEYQCRECGEKTTRSSTVINNEETNRSAYERLNDPYNNDHDFFRF